MKVDSFEIKYDTKNHGHTAFLGAKAPLEFAQ